MIGFGPKSLPPLGLSKKPTKRPGAEGTEVFYAVLFTGFLFLLDHRVDDPPPFPLGGCDRSEGAVGWFSVFFAFFDFCKFHFFKLYVDEYFMKILGV